MSNSSVSISDLRLGGAAPVSAASVISASEVQCLLGAQFMKSRAKLVEAPDESGAARDQ